MRPASPKKLPVLHGGQEFKPSSKQGPFLIGRVVLTNSEISEGSGDGGKRLKLCKRCESLTVGMGGGSIHSTLAYRRCRCHRLFKYRKQKQASVSAASGNNHQDAGLEMVSNLPVGELNLGTSSCRGSRLEPLRIQGRMKVEEVGGAPKVRQRRPNAVASKVTEPLHMPGRREIEEVGGVPRVRQRRPNAALVSKVKAQAITRPLNHDTGVRTSNESTSGCLLPPLSSVSILPGSSSSVMKQQQPAGGGSVVRFSGSSVTK